MRRQLGSRVCFSLCHCLTKQFLVFFNSITWPSESPASPLPMQTLLSAEQAKDRQCSTTGRSAILAFVGHVCPKSHRLCQCNFLGGSSHAAVLDLSHWFSFKWASSLLCKLPSWEAVFDLFSVHLQFVLIALVKSRRNTHGNIHTTQILTTKLLTCYLLNDWKSWSKSVLQLLSTKWLQIPLCIMWEAVFTNSWRAVADVANENYFISLSRITNLIWPSRFSSNLCHDLSALLLICPCFCLSGLCSHSHFRSVMPVCLLYPV